jgi:hypothetical protein
VKTTLPDGTEWDTRRAPHMERFVRIQPTVVRGVDDAHLIFLKIGNQEFQLSSGAYCFYETLEEAEFVRDMLCIALDRLQRGEDL